MADTTGKPRGRRGRSAQPPPPYPDERLGNFIRGLLLGALVGGVVALLLARRSGAATRADLANRVQAARTKARDLTTEARLAVSDFAAWAAESEEPPPPPPSADTLSLAATSSLAALTSAPTGPLPRVTRP